MYVMFSGQSSLGKEYLHEEKDGGDLSPYHWRFKKLNNSFYDSNEPNEETDS